jgi:hypothetical protein
MNKLNTSVKVTELGDTALRLVKVFKAVAAVQNDAFLTKTFAEIEKQATEMTAAVKSDQALSKLEEVDAQRDQAIRVLDKLLKGYENIPLENLKTHAKKLAEIFKKYGVKITGENYASQSTLINSLLGDFSATELKPSIEALAGVKEALAEIQTKQNAFAALRSDYEKAQVSQKEKSSATSLRKPLLELINKKAVPYLVAMSIAQPELFKNLTAEASEIITSTNEAIKARSKKEKKEKK